MSDDTKTIIGPGTKVSVTLLIVLISPIIWLLSLTYELKYDIASLRSEIAYIRLNAWTISDMERYRFKAQVENASIGVKVPDVHQIVSERPK